MVTAAALGPRLGTESVAADVVAGADRLPARSTAWTVTCTVVPHGRESITAVVSVTVPTVAPSWPTR